MTKLEIDIDIGDEPANLVVESIEVTLKAVAKDRLDSDDADAVFDLQTAYLLYHKKKINIFKHDYHWTDENLKEYGLK